MEYFMHYSLTYHTIAMPQSLWVVYLESPLAASLPIPNRSAEVEMQRFPELHVVRSLKRRSFYEALHSPKLFLGS